MQHQQKQRFAEFISDERYLMYYLQTNLYTSLVTVQAISSILGVKVRNMKMDFNTGCTWHRVAQ